MASPVSASIPEQTLYIHVFSNVQVISGVQTTTPIILTLFSNSDFAFGAKEVVINRLNEDLENPNACLSDPAVILESGASLTGSVDSSTGITDDSSINSLLTVVSKPSYFRLQHFFHLYLENKFYSLGEVTLYPAVALGCAPQFSSFPIRSLDPKTVYCLA